MCDEKRAHLHYLPILGVEEEYLLVDEEDQTGEQFLECVEQVVGKAKTDIELLPDGAWKFATGKLLDMWEQTAEMCVQLNGHNVDDEDRAILQNMPNALLQTLVKFAQNAMSRDFVLPSVSIN